VHFKSQKTFIQKKISQKTESLVTQTTWKS